MLKNRFAVRFSDMFGSAIAIASFVISVIRLSIGVIRMFTPKPAPTPAKAAASPASGWLPRPRNAAAPRGIRIR